MRAASSNTKTVGRPFPKGQSGNPKGRALGSKNEAKTKTLPLTEALSAVELAGKGHSPRQIARLLKARPTAVREALAQSRRLLEVCSTRFAEDWLVASRVAASEGDHKPAMAALQSIEVVKPIAQTYDTGAAGGKAVAAVQVQFVGFGFAGLPQPAAPEPTTTIDVTARSGT
jgi:hypothetical protein